MESKRTCQLHGSILLVCVFVFVFVQNVAAVTSVNVVVPGTSDPWLAGMPNGSTASAGGGDVDVAPTHSPVEVLGLLLTPGTELTFEASGGVSNGPAIPLVGPDGGAIFPHTAGAENGIADITVPLNSLIGVFLGPDQPDLSAAPSALDFSSGASRDFLTLSPLVKQPFFIGDGLTSGNQVQAVVVPIAATRLFLGTMDGFGWFNNLGQFDVQINEPDPVTNPAIPEPLTVTLGLVTLSALGVTMRRRIA